MANHAKNLTNDAVWLVTGCSSGLGAAFVTHIAKAGHRVVATARKVSTLDYLEDGPNVLKLKLDVTSPADITAVVTATVEKFGRIDVLINNAGYGLMGDFESVTDMDARKQFETNFWGAINMTREVLRVFREVNPIGLGGTVVQVSSMGGFIGFPGNAFYHASKFALEGATEGIAKEMPPEWNIKFLLLEPGGIKTEYAETSISSVNRHPAYLGSEYPTSKLLAYLENPDARTHWGEAADVARTVFNTISRKGERAIPLRLPMGSDAYTMMIAETEVVANELREWKPEIEAISNPAQVESINFLRK